MKRIRCTVERITYESPETGYVVLKGWVEDYKKKIPLIGNMFGVKTGSLIEAEGAGRLILDMAANLKCSTGKNVFLPLQ